MQFKKYLKRYKFKFLYSIFLSNFYQHNSNIIQNTSRVLNLSSSQSPLYIRYTFLFSLLKAFNIINFIICYLNISLKIIATSNTISTLNQANWSYKLLLQKLNSRVRSTSEFILYTEAQNLSCLKKNWQP